MTVVGEAFIEISPTDKGFEGKVVATANAAAKKAAGALVLPASADTEQLDRTVVAAAKAAAKKAAAELADIPGGVDAETFTTKVQAAAAAAADKAAAKLRNIPTGLDVAGLEVQAANAAARAATSAGGQLDGIPMGVESSTLVRDVDAAMDKAERRVDDGAKRMASDTGGALSGLGGLVAKSFAAIGVGQLVFGGVAEVRAARAEARQTEAVIRSTGGAANVTAKEIDNLSAKLSAKNAVDDDAIRGGANLLLTFTNVRNEVGKGNAVFNDATQVLVDMAAALGTDVRAGAIQLGKALNDPIAGVSALAEVGVTFTEQQKVQIRTMVEAGDTAQAQKVILAELRKEFGGSAAAQADDLDHLALKYDDFKERVGGAVLTVVGALSEVPGPVQAIGAGLAGVAVAAVGISKVADAVSSLRDRMADLSVQSPRAANALGFASRGVAGAVGLGLLAGVVNELDDAINNWQSGPPVVLDELTNSLVRFQQEGKASGALAEQFGGDLGGLADKVKLLTDLGGVDISFGEDAKRDVDALDQSLAGLVRTGQTKLADSLLTQLARDAGVSVPEIRKHLDAYGGALAAVDTEQRLAADSSTDLAGASADTSSAIEDEAAAADKAAKALADFKTALDDALGVQIAAERAAIDYIDTVQALRDQITEHGNTLDLNTEVGRRNREAILAVIDASRQHIEAMADEGATAGELNSTWATHRGELAQVLSQLGLTKAEASTYLGLLDKVPETVFTDLSVRDEVAAAKVRSFAKLMDDRLGTERIITIKLNPVTGKLEQHTGPEFREHGGPVYRGRPYVTGERRPEWYEPSGWVLPSPPPPGAQPRVLGRDGPELFSPPAAGRVLPQVPAWASGLSDDELRRRLAELRRQAELRGTWRAVPRAASGGIVQPTPGGTLVQVAEAGQAEAILPLPPGLVQALERLAGGGAGGGGLLRDLVVQGGPDPYSTGLEVVRQLRAEHERSTGASLFA